ncbi:MAG: hypothetical protein RLZZ540_3542 [Bacteroidota bacterium]|jgi:hypothetical protein
MDNKEINLEIITKQFRKKGAAAKGYATVNKLLKENEDVNLKILLRNHKTNPVISFLEVKERDNIDFLIDYYSILEIGLISGYLPNPLPLKIENEAKKILTNEFLNKYFTKHYPLLLPQLLVKQLTKHSGQPYFDKSYSTNSSTIYDRFLMLRQFIKDDTDIDQFLWFLDDGYTAGYTILDLWNILADKSLIEYKLGRNNKHPLNSALWGFVKYIQFLSDFAALLRDAEKDTLLQAALWHHQSYWFEHLKERVEDIINIGIKNIRESMKNINSNEIIADKNSFLNSEEDIALWQNNSLLLNGIEDDVNYLLNNNLGQPLINYFNEL